jgi:drug/metabolite transporter (DMT)-like permease
MNTTKGIYLALITAFISGIAIFVNKFAVTAIQPPVVFTAVKNAGVGLLILSLLLASRKWKLVKKLKRRELIYLVLIGIIGGSIPFYLFFTGLTQIPAINAVIIQKTLVIWVALLAIPLLKEKMSVLQIFGVILLFGANLLVGGFQGFTFLEGEFLVLIATIFWAIENVLAKKILPTVDPDIVVSARMGLGSIILLGAAAITAPAALTKSLSLTPTQWLFMIIAIATLLGYVMSWYRALKYAPATTVASILVASTLITNVLSAIFVTHTWTILMGIQGVLMIIGIAVFWLAAKKEPNTALSNI